MVRRRWLPRGLLRTVALLAWPALLAAAPAAAVADPDGGLGDTARQILAEPRFQDHLPEPLTRAQQQEYSQPEQRRSAAAPRPERVAVPPPEVRSTGGARFLLWVLLAVVIGFAVFWVAGESRALQRRAAWLAAPPEEHEHDPRAGPQLDAAAADGLAAAGRVAEAIHVLLVDALRHLVATNAVAIRSSTTSREVLRQLTSTNRQRSLLTVLVVAVEHSWFGGMVMTGDDYRRCRDAWQKVRSGT